MSNDSRLYLLEQDGKTHENLSNSKFAVVKYSVCFSLSQKLVNRITVL